MNSRPRDIPKNEGTRPQDSRNLIGGNPNTPPTDKPSKPKDPKKEGTRSQDSGKLLAPNRHSRNGNN